MEHDDRRHVRGNQQRAQGQGVFAAPITEYPNFEHLEADAQKENRRDLDS